MNQHYRLRSKLRIVIRRYIALKRALGRKFDLESYQLARLDRFLASHKSDLAIETFSAWCARLKHLTPRGRRLRLRIVYNLCIYRRRTEPDCFVPDPSQFPPLPARRKPHIFTEAEICALLRGTNSLVPHPCSPLHRHAARLAVVLLYTCGLRRGEVIRLTLGDYNAVDKLLVIRESKFNKSRLIPLSKDGLRELDQYLQHRTAPRFPCESASPLLLNNHGGDTGYTGPGFAHMIRKLYRRANIRTRSGRLPRIHDLRFTFAVHALLRWYRQGEDLHAKLPALSTYMGHVSIVSTQYYLPFVDDVSEIASAQFDRHFAMSDPQLFTGGAR